MVMVCMSAWITVAPSFFTSASSSVNTFFMHSSTRCRSAGSRRDENAERSQRLSCPRRASAYGLRRSVASTSQLLTSVRSVLNAAAASCPPRTPLSPLSLPPPTVLCSYPNSAPCSRSLRRCALAMAHTARWCALSSTHTHLYAPGLFTSARVVTRVSSSPESAPSPLPPPRSGTPPGPVHRSCAESRNARAKNVSAV